MAESNSIIKSIADFITRITKEPAEEAGGMIADRVRFWRLKQAVALKAKAEELLIKRGVTNTRAVSLKLTVAILDGATIEEEDELHTLWSTLLANALDPAFAADVRYSYTEILRALSPFDALLLKEIYLQSEHIAKELNRTIQSVETDLPTISKKMKSTKEEILLSADCLIRQRLIFQLPTFEDGPQYIANEDGETKWVNAPPRIIGISKHRVALTSLGFGFVKCCQ